MAYKWVAVLGSYEFLGQEIVFHGGEREYGGELGAEIGNAISDQRFTGGEISARIRFDEPIDAHIGCEIIRYYEPATRYFMSAGLGGTPINEFSVRYFDNRGWNLVGVAGERRNLKAGAEY